MKSYTDLGQSKKLAEILPIESADMFWRYNHNIHTCDDIPKILVVNNWDDDYNKNIPCWSLVALLDVLPTVKGFKPVIDLDINQLLYEGIYRDILRVNNVNLIDACYEMIIRLHELNLL